jgi:hypothetical protein
VGSYWHLSAGGRELASGKNYVPDQLMMLFVDSERIVDETGCASLERLRVAEEDPVEAEWADLKHLFRYVTTAAALKSRLTLQGFGGDVITEYALEFLRGEDDEERWDPDPWLPFRGEYAQPEKLLNAMISWRRRKRPLNLSKESDEDRFLDSRWDEMIGCFDDPRVALTLLLERTRKSTDVVLDLTDLLDGGWLESDEVPHRTSLSRFANEVASSGPIVVVTEGRTDSDLLRRATALAAPELAHAFSFLDFEGFSAPGGVDRVVSLTRGMAAAQVMNRVLAVLDNDTAGRQGLQQLHRSKLAPRMTATLLPNVAYARSYPTIGPNGLQNGDVNGRAVTIEMMFGLQVLRDPTSGDLAPVRWIGYNDMIADYQGKLEDKGSVQSRIQTALSADSIGGLPPDLARGCRRLVQMLIETAARATPTLATDYSPLLWQRVRQQATAGSASNQRAQSR